MCPFGNKADFNTSSESIPTAWTVTEDGGGIEGVKITRKTVKAERLGQELQVAEHGDANVPVPCRRVLRPGELSATDYGLPTTDEIEDTVKEVTPRGNDRRDEAVLGDADSQPGAPITMWTKPREFGVALA